MSAGRHAMPRTLAYALRSDRRGRLLWRVCMVLPWQRRAAQRRAAAFAWAYYRARQSRSGNLGVV